MASNRIVTDEGAYFYGSIQCGLDSQTLLRERNGTHKKPVYHNESTGSTCLNVYRGKKDGNIIDNIIVLLLIR